MIEFVVTLIVIISCDYIADHFGNISVTFNDDDPKKGFSTIFLTIPNMKVKKGFLCDTKPVNAEVNPEYTSV